MLIILLILLICAITLTMFYSVLIVSGEMSDLEDWEDYLEDEQTATETDGEEERG